MLRASTAAWCAAALLLATAGTVGAAPPATAARSATAPPATATPAAPAATPAAGGAVSHYSLDQAKSTLEFSFTQAGALNKGHFARFPVKFAFAADNLAASSLEVSVEINSLDTGDKDRDDTLRSADLFNLAKFPQAHFSATQIVKTGAGYEAVGKLTIRDVTRETRVPFTFRTATEQGATVGYMSGKLTIRRLDFGVGQGEWRSTDQVGNEVGVAFALRLTAAAH